MEKKTRVTLRLRPEVLELVLKQGYATRRTLGEFVSQLILDYHHQQRESSTPHPSLEDWRQLVDEAKQLLHPAANSD